MGSVALVGRPRPGKELQVDPTGGYRDLLRRDPHRFQLEGLVGAGGDDPVRSVSDGGLQPLPLEGAGVRGALMAAFHRAQCVEGLNDRDGGPPGGHPGRVKGRQARHPEVPVNQVRWPRFPVV